MEDESRADRIAFWEALIESANKRLALLWPDAAQVLPHLDVTPPRVESTKPAVREVFNFAKHPLLKATESRFLAAQQEDVSKKCLPSIQHGRFYTDAFGEVFQRYRDYDMEPMTCLEMFGPATAEERAAVDAAFWDDVD